MNRMLKFSYFIENGPRLKPNGFFNLEYRLISKTGEGSFSEVIKAQHTVSGNYVAIKCMKNSYESIENVRI